MGYEVDYGPIDYLKRRIKYYKKKRASAKRILNMGFMIEKYGKQRLKKMVATRVNRVEDFIREFEHAIKILEANK